MDSPAPLRISVVTPAHNRPESLLRLLRALRDGSFPASDFEAVIVADGCTDDTAARSRAESLPFRVSVLEQNPGRGAATARNLGAAHAVGELLVFLDDDIEPSHGLLAEHWREYVTAVSPSVVVGPPLPVRAAQADLHSIAAWGWWHRQFAQMRRPGHRFTYEHVFSGNLSVPRALFAELGGFDEEQACREDFEFGLRAIKQHAAVKFAPEAAAWHHELRNAEALISRKQEEGAADVRLAQLHPEVWPTLRISLPEPPAFSGLGIVRRLACDAPRLGPTVAVMGRRMLPVLESVRLRGTWRALQAGLMYFWYWHAAARAVGGRMGLAALRENCLTRIAELRDGAGRDLEIDLADGLESAERSLDAASASSVTIRWGPLSVGRIPASPGAEQLGGRHMRAALAAELKQPLKGALATVAMMRWPVFRRADLPAVSVIIPAYNAAETLGATLDSLMDQTSQNWEAVIVDDGSTDDTAAVAARYASIDKRVRVLRQDQRGESAARNAGLAEAINEWILFLDSDDFILPSALERLLKAAVDDGTVDVVHGGWSRVTPDGLVMEAEYCAHAGDLFPQFVRHCAFPIHSALVRRSAVLRVGSFDSTLTTCEDWDLWQRLARSGAKFGRVPAEVARYRMRVGSLSTHVRHLWPDGLRVIAQGHRADPRVAEPAHPKGAPAEQLIDARFEFACWVAGLIIGQDGNPAEVLAALADDRHPGLNPELVAYQLFRTVPLATAQALDVWDDLWPALIPRIGSFLSVIERQSGAYHFAQRAMHVLERLTLGVSRMPRPFTRGGTLAAVVEASEPLPSLSATPNVDRAHCTVLAGGSPIGSVLLPLGSDVQVNGRALAAEIAARYAWPILGWFLGGGPYRDLVLQRGPRGISVLRNRVQVATELSDAEAIDAAKLHDRVGWTVFLQELWGCPDYSADHFYQARTDEALPLPEPVDKMCLTIDVSAELPLLQLPSGQRHCLELDVRVGGAPIGVASLSVSATYVRPAELRAAITLQSAFALCRAAVQEGLLGRPRDVGGTLRQRLAARAAQRRDNEVSAERFPAPPNEGAATTADSGFDRHHFESVFAKTTDPWSYVTPYEQLKYEQTLGVLPEGAIGRALELACAEGRFTRQLAPRVAELVAADISTIALERARSACNGMQNVRFVQLDLVKDPLPGHFDLIVCSEVLYYVGSTEALTAVGVKLRDALAPGGRFIVAHANVTVDDPAETALDWNVPFGAKGIGECLARLPNVRFVHELRTELYRIQTFQRCDDAHRTDGGPDPIRPDTVEHARHAPPAPHVAAYIRRPLEQRLRAPAAAQPQATSHLPILMYHHIGPLSLGATRYRVTSDAFKAQLDYLKSAGFRCVTLEDWRAAVHYRRPLPGRAVVISFDDAYRDFAEYAFPLLQLHGFSATVFVPCGYAGGTNGWDSDSGESAALLTWDHMRELATQGISFGAHSMTHVPMTGLAAADIIREAAESKAILERELETSVTAFAYPHGDTDAIVQQHVAACGYSVALSTRSGRAGFNDPLMALPRIEVSGYDDLATFIAKLGA